MFLFPEIPCYSNIYSSELTFISNHRSRWKIRKFQIGFLEIFQNFESKKNWMENILPLIDFQKISRTKSWKKKFFSCIIRLSEYSTTPILKNFSIHPTFNSFNQFHSQKYSPRRIPTRVVFEQRLKEAWKKKKRRGQQRFSKWSKKCDNRHRGWRHSPLSLGGHWCIRSLLLLLSLFLFLKSRARRVVATPFDVAEGQLSILEPSLLSLPPYFRIKRRQEKRVSATESCCTVFTYGFIFSSLFFSFSSLFAFISHLFPFDFFDRPSSLLFHFYSFLLPLFSSYFSLPDGGRQLLLRSSIGRKEKGKERLS